MKKENRRRRHLEVFIESESSAVLRFIRRIFFLLSAGHHTGLLVVSNTLFEEVGLPGKGNVVHEVEGVGGIVEFLVSKSNEESVGNKLDVLAHEFGIHAEKSTRKCIRQKLLFDADCLGNDSLDSSGVWAVVEVGEQETGEVSVETFITGDEFVREGKARHKTTLLQPEDGGKRAAEEDTFDGSEGNETLGKGGILILNPPDGPIGFFADARN